MGLKQWITERTASPDYAALVRVQLGTDRLVGMVTAMNQAADVTNQLMASGLSALNGVPAAAAIGGDAISMARSIPLRANNAHLIAVSERRVSWFDISTGAALCVATADRSTVAMSRIGEGQNGFAEVRFSFTDGSFVVYLCSTSEIEPGFWDAVS